MTTDKPNFRRPSASIGRTDLFSEVDPAALNLNLLEDSGYRPTEEPFAVPEHNPVVPSPANANDIPPLFIAFLDPPPGNGDAAPGRPQEKPRVEAVERPELRELSEEEIERLTFLQEILIAGLTDLRISDPAWNQLTGRVRDELNGVVRNERGEITRELGRPYMGDATREALQAWLNKVERESLPGLYTRLNNLGSRRQIPTNGPIPLQIDDGGRAIPTSLCLSRVANGELTCNLNIDVQNRRIPSEAEIQRISGALEFMDRAEMRLAQIATERQMELTRLEIQRLGMPSEWRIETPEQASAAMMVMNVARETGRIIDCLNHLSTEVSGPRQAEFRALIAAGNLPPGVIVEREGNRPNGAVNRVRFDFPRHLNLQDQAFRNQLLAMYQFCERNGRMADQMMASRDNATSDRNSIAFMDLESPYGWVRMAPGKDGEPPQPEFKQSQERPEGQGWSRCNLIELRSSVHETRDPSTGNISSIRVDNAMDYCNVPMWSYLNLYRRRADNMELVETRGRERNPNDWACVRVSPTEVRYMRYRDVAGHLASQEIHYWLNKGVTAAMDISMLVGGVGEIAAGVRAVRAARSGMQTLDMVRTASQFSRARSGAELLEMLSSNTAALATAQQSLRASGRSHIWRGVRESLLGLSGIPTNNVAAQETAGLREAAIGRSVYFLGSIGWGTGRTVLYDAPGSAIRTLRGIERPVTLAERLMQANMQTAPSWIRACQTAGHYGFGVTQFPFVWEQVQQLRHMAEATDPTVNNPLEARTRRREAQRLHNNPFESRDRLQQNGAANTAEILRTLDNFRSALGVNDGRRQQIDEIINGTRQLITDAPWLAHDFVGPPDPARVAEWERRRRDFIDQKIAPLFLASGQEIRDHEVARARRIPVDQLTQQPALTDEEIANMQRDGRFGARDREVRAAAACALLYLCRSANGSLQGVSMENGRAVSTDTLFQRELVTPPWEVERIISTDPETGQSITEIFAVPKPGHVRRAAQQITMADVTTILERDLRAGTNVERRIMTGDVLTRVGLPCETFTASLQKIIQETGTTNEQRNRAIVYLGSIMQATRGVEAQRAGLSADARFVLGGLSNGLGSRDIQQFLGEFARNPNNDLNTRAMAACVMMFGERTNLSREEIDRFEAVITRQPPAITFDNFLRDMREAAFNNNCQSVADWERRLQASLTLTSFLDLGPQRLGFGANEINSSIAACVNAPVAFEQMAIAPRQALGVARGQNNAQEVSRLERELQVINRQRVQAGDVGYRALTELMRTVSQDGRLQRRIDCLDASDDATMRASGMNARRTILDLLKNRCDNNEDLRIRRQIMAQLEPLLSDSRLGSNNANRQETASQLAAMRTEIGQVLQQILVPGLTTRGAQFNQRVQQFPGQINTDLLRPYTALYHAAHHRDFGGGIRESAIEALSAMNSRLAANIIRTRAYVENEAVPDVRLAALRALRRLLPADEFRALAQGIVSRTINDAAHPPERDPAVAAELEERRAAIGFGVHPDGQVFRDIRNDTQTELANNQHNPETVRNLIRDGQPLAWLRPDNVAQNVATAMHDVYHKDSWFPRISAAWDDSPALPGAPLHVSSNRERVAREEALKAFDSRFANLCRTATGEQAVGESGLSQAQARDVLYCLITGNINEWQPSSTRSGLPRGVNGLSLNVNEATFRNLQALATENLIKCGTRRENGRLVPLADEHGKAWERLMIQTMLHPSTPGRCRLELFNALSVIGRAPGASASFNQRICDYLLPHPCPPGYRGLLEALQPVPSLANSANAAERERHGEESEARERFAWRALNFIERHNTNPRMFAQLEGIARTESVSPVMRQRAFDVIANARDRVIPRWQAIMPDQINGQNLQARLTLLESASDAAQPRQMVLVRNAQPGQEASSESRLVVRGPEDPALDDTAKDLGELYAERAVDYICQSMKGMPITAPDDPRAGILRGLLSDRYHERVRLTAAIALAKESTVPEHRREAATALAGLSISSNRPGIRSDAQEILRQNRSQEETAQSAITALQQIQQGLVSQMRTRLAAAGVADINQLSQSEVIRQMQQRGVDNRLLMQYANCLSNQGTMEARNGSAGVPEPFFLAAVNIYRGQAVDTAFNPASSSVNQESLAPFRRFIGTEYLREMTSALEQLGQVRGILSGEVSSRRIVDLAHGIRRRSLGEWNPEVVESGMRRCQAMVEQAETLRPAYAQAAQQVVPILQQVQQLEQQLANATGAARTPIEAQITEARTRLQQRLQASGFETHLSAYREQLERAAANYAALAPNIIEAFGRNSRQAAEYCDRRADIFEALSIVEARRAALTTGEARRRQLQQESNTHMNQAGTFLRHALRARENSHMPQTEILASRQRLATFYFNNKRYGDCQEQLESMQNQLVSQDSAALANVLGQLAVVQYTIAKQPAGLLSSLSDLINQNNQSQNQHENTHRQQGDTHYQNQLAMIRRLHGERSPQAAATLEGQARQYMQQRRFDRAEAALRDCLQCTGQAITPQMLASRQFMLADACFGQPARRQQAVAPIEECLRICREDDPGSEQSLRHLLYGIGALVQIDRPRALQAIDAYARTLTQSAPGSPQELRIQAGSPESLRILDRVADVYARIGEYQSVAQTVETYAQTLINSGIPRQNVRTLVLNYAQALEAAAGRTTDATQRANGMQVARQMRTRWPENQ